MNKERLATFIDAVLAIVITILVLELRKPDPISLNGFLALRENFFAYALSFFWLGAMWVNLHNEWYRIKRINTKTIWAAMLILFFSSLLPYATSIVSENFNNRAAQGFYGVVVLMITLANILSYYTLSKGNNDDAEEVRQLQMRNRWLIGDVLIKCIGLVISLLWFPPAMMYAVLVTLLVLFIPNQISYIKKEHHIL